LWRENDVSIHGEGTKQIGHPEVGCVTKFF